MSMRSDQRPTVESGDQILEAVGYAAERFLTAENWEQVIPEVLERLGRATDVSRLYVYDNSLREDGELVMSQRWEWCGPGVEATIGWENTIGYPYSDGYQHFRDELAAGRAIYGLTSEFPESEQADMELEGIVSNAVVPIFAGPNWWGYIGFDHCVDEHLWSSDEIDALLAAAGTLGATIFRNLVESELAGTTEQLHDVEQRYQALVEQIPAVLYMDPIDVQGAAIYVSPQVEEILGVTQEDYLADPDMWRKLAHPDDLEKVEADYISFLETGQPEASDYRMVRPDGRVVWIHDRATILHDEKGEPFVTQGVMFDVTKQKEAEQQVAFMAYHDRLTGLPNRAMFEEHLEFALARAGRTDKAVAVLFMDLDNFKLLNDTKGHAAGDELLQKIALRMRDATRETDLVARQGGDEFLVLIGDIEMNGVEEGSSPYVVAESVASRVLQSLETPFRIDGEDYYTSASIGIALFPMDARDAATLLMNADSAMYRSKRSGSARYTVHRDDH
ncbi:MAG: diguanylate cyclase, partial [Actinobacteria bacterium]|nr:diguanylate cyclase [Actinomycetota bacterium]